MAMIVGFVYSVMFSLTLLVILSFLSLFHKKKQITFVTNMVLLATVAISSFAMLALKYNYTLFGMISFTPFSNFFMGLFSIALMLISTLALEHSDNYGIFSFLLSLSFFGMFFVTDAVSLLEILLGLELVSLPTVFMILSGGKTRLEAALKLFILSMLALTALVFAISLSFPYNSSLMLSSLSLTAGNATPYFLILAIILFVASLGVETALFPFNLWVPDVYEGSPGHTTALLAGVNKKVAFVAMLEIFLVMFLALKGTFSPILAFLAVLTMFFGNILAMVQKNVKRLFAYSSISQAGYILIGISVATTFGAEASAFQIFVHSFMIIGAFAIVSWLAKNNIKTIKDYSGLSKSNMFAAVSLTILMLSMAGVPPLMGFYGKFLLFSSALFSHNLYLAFFGIINSFISIYYYGKVINSMFIKKVKRTIHMRKATFATVAVCIAIVIIFGIYPQPILSLASAASTALI